MPNQYALVFDEVIIKQLRKAAKNQGTKQILTRMLDKLEIMGGSAGKLLDLQLSIYEIKNKNPPLRLYFKPIEGKNEIYVFEFEMKTSAKKQQNTIDKLKGKARNLKS